MNRAAETGELAAILRASVHGTAGLVMSQLIPAGAGLSVTVCERIVAAVARHID